MYTYIESTQFRLMKGTQLQTLEDVTFARVDHFQQII